MISSDSPTIELISTLESPLNLATIFISVAALIYMKRIFNKSGGFSKHDKAWMWFLSSIFSVLLLNLSTHVFIITGGSLAATMDKESFDTTLGFVMAVNRFLIAISMTVGAYILYTSMKTEGDMRFSFKPVIPQPESMSTKSQKYDLKAGFCYLASKPVADKSNEEKPNPMDVFVDLVTHGVVGLAITRAYPVKVRETYRLSKTPLVWLTYEKDKNAVTPYDLETLNNIVRNFISNQNESAVIIDGLEYLILHNSFETVLKFIQSLVDLVVKSESRLIISIDPLSMTQQQYHLLLSELDEMKLSASSIEEAA